jgi:hypothetical protein
MTTYFQSPRLGLIAISAIVAHMGLLAVSLT